MSAADKIIDITKIGLRFFQEDMDKNVQEIDIVVDLCYEDTKKRYIIKSKTGWEVESAIDFCVLLKTAEDAANIIEKRKDKK